MPGIDELSEIWTWLEIIKETQFQWLELRTAPTDKALILSVHHSPFSADEEHSGSDTILKVLDKAFRQDTVCPTLFSQDMFTITYGREKTQNSISCNKYRWTLEATCHAETQ
jgi:hypothetical protein